MAATAVGTTWWCLCHWYGILFLRWYFGCPLVQEVVQHPLVKVPDPPDLAYSMFNAEGFAHTELAVVIAIPLGPHNETLPAMVPFHRKVTACFLSSF